MWKADIDDVETCWVLRRYNPSDLRSKAPVPQLKVQSNNLINSALRHWVPQLEAPPKSFSRFSEEKEGGLPSSPSTRSEEWSTLRQMLPSRGWSVPRKPPRWGTGATEPPYITRSKVHRFPFTNSPMTNYVDEMHRTNRLATLQPTPL